MTLLSVAGLFIGNTKAAFYGYLVGFAYWVGLSFAALALLMILHTFKAKWSTVLEAPH